jgi:hypothetical protein
MHVENAADPVCEEPNQHPKWALRAAKKMRRLFKRELVQSNRFGGSYDLNAGPLPSFLIPLGGARRGSQIESSWLCRGMFTAFDQAQCRLA